jgi:hypothetical protein
MVVKEPHPMPTTPSIESLVQNFTNNLSQVMRRAALEEVHAKLSLVIGDAAPKTRRPRATVSKSGKRGHPGKFTSDQLDAMGAKILAILKQAPGARSEQLSAAMKLDAATLRIPLKALVKAKKIKVKGQKRGTRYFAR